MQSGGWRAVIRAEESQPGAPLDRALLRRVFAYGRPYWRAVSMVLVTIIAVSLIELIPPLLYRDLIDNVLPGRDARRLNLLAAAMLGIPVLTGALHVVQRYFSARAGEGIIFDLRQEMYRHLQRMSLRFFTDTKSGEIVSRFNSDVVGAQSAITGTVPSIVTNVVTLISTLAVMITIEWRLALLSVIVLPLFLLPARRVARTLRRIRRSAMEHNAEMSNIVNETLAVNGALLVKTFGSQGRELQRFSKVNAAVRDIGVRRAQVGQLFFMSLGMASAIGSALIYWAGGHLVLGDAISIGTVVAFAAYLGRLYGPISSLTNVQVEFAQSMVSFERVFEYLDLPVEIDDKPDAVRFDRVAGHIRFDNVWFQYREIDPEPAAVEDIHGDGFDPGMNEDEDGAEPSPSVIPAALGAGRRLVRDLARRAGGAGRSQRRGQDHGHLLAAPPI